MNAATYADLRSEVTRTLRQLSRVQIGMLHNGEASHIENAIQALNEAREELTRADVCRRNRERYRARKGQP